MGKAALSLSLLVCFVFTIAVLALVRYGHVDDAEQQAGCPFGRAAIMKNHRLKGRALLTGDLASGGFSVRINDEETTHWSKDQPWVLEHSIGMEHLITVLATDSFNNSPPRFFQDILVRVASSSLGSHDENTMMLIIPPNEKDARISPECVAKGVSGLTNKNKNAKRKFSVILLDHPNDAVLLYLDVTVVVRDNQDTLEYYHTQFTLLLAESARKEEDTIASSRMLTTKESNTALGMSLRDMVGNSVPSLSPTSDSGDANPIGDYTDFPSASPTSREDVRLFANQPFPSLSPTVIPSSIPSFLPSKDTDQANAVGYYTPFPSSLPTTTNPPSSSPSVDQA